MAFPHDGKKFKKGQSGNPNGRPRKSFRAINAKMSEAGIEKLSRVQLMDAYSLLLNCTEDELAEMQNDNSLPLAFRIIIKELQDKRTRYSALKDYRDYLFGKAIQQTDITTKGESINQMTEEQLRQRAKELINEQKE